MTWALDAAAACAVLGAAGGLGVPRLIARIPEPAPSPEPVPVPGPEPSLGSEPSPASEPLAVPRADAHAQPKVLYTDIAEAPGLAGKSAVASAAAAAVIGGSVGWSWSLLFLLYLVTVGVALGIVDGRTRLLPTKVILPSYAVVLALAALAAVLSGEPGALLRAVYGLVIARTGFWVLWFVYPRGLGFGDVRLAGLLGLALGYLGWGPLIVGLYAGFLIGGVGGVLLAALGWFDRRRYPFGPAILLGALVGIAVGERAAGWYLGR